MNEQLTHIIFILDRSGSMGGLEDDTIGGFNSMIQNQRKLDSEALITTVLFDHEIITVYDKQDIKEINLLTKEQYFVRGTTALLDAIGKTIKKVRNDYADTLREQRPSKVLFVITTDGMENASKYYTSSDIKELVEQSTKQYNWEFIFMGANMDAFKEAQLLGIRKERTVRYRSDHVGTKKNFKAMDRVMTSFRTSGCINENWKNEIDDEFKIREFR